MLDHHSKDTSINKEEKEAPMSDSQPAAQPEQASAPDVNTASDAPKKTRRTLVIVIGLVVLALCLCVGACLVVYVGSRESPIRLLLDQRAVTAVADQFMREMEKKDAEAAYALFSTHAQQYVALSDLKQFLDDDLYVHFEGYESLSVRDGGNFEIFWDVVGDDPRMPQGTVANLVVVVKYEGGYEGTLTATFEKEGREWGVYKLDVTAPPSKINSP
jgi:hypothetical protein